MLTNQGQVRHFCLDGKLAALEDAKIGQQFWFGTYFVIVWRAVNGRLNGLEGKCVNRIWPERGHEYAWRDVWED